MKKLNKSRRRNLPRKNVRITNTQRREIGGVTRNDSLLNSKAARASSSRGQPAYADGIVIICKTITTRVCAFSSLEIDGRKVAHWALSPSSYFPQEFVANSKQFLGLTTSSSIHPSTLSPVILNSCSTRSYFLFGGGIETENKLIRTLETRCKVKFYIMNPNYYRVKIKRNSMKTKYISLVIMECFHK